MYKCAIDHEIDWICEVGVTEGRLTEGKPVEKASVLRIVRVCSLVLAIAVGVFFLSEYLRIVPSMVGRLILAVLSLAACAMLRNNPALKKREYFILAVFSALFDLSLVLGFHIVLSEGDGYSGTASENFISEYSIIDVIAFVFMFIVIALISFAFYSAIKFGLPGRLGGCVRCAVKGVGGISVIDKRVVLLFALVLFISWVPYLVIYYPGFIFGDTTNSLGQLMGWRAFSNHHPIAYTLFIGACLQVAHFVGLGNAAGCALYCIIQMALMAICFSYSANWIVSRFGISPKWQVVLFALFFVYFGMSPYIATYSIAMWKDPIFSVSLLMITLLLADVVLFGKAKGVRFTWVTVLAFAFFALIAVFFRNNGVYILAFTTMLLAVWLIVTRKDKRASRSGADCKGVSARSYSKRVLAVAVGVVVLFFVVTLPGFRLAGIQGASSSESLGIPINQMARVAAVGGDMTDSDREYLDSILPFDRYSETYRPCCVDLLKWDSDYNSTAAKQGIAEHWLSMLVRNPLVYFESWELQTFGFWAVNQPDVYEFDNIAGGVPKNNTSRMDDYGIDRGAGISNEMVRSLFPSDESSIPIGAIFWLLLYFCVAACLLGNTSWLVILGPSLALLGTLLVATPIWYWPRYAVAVQFLFPVYLALFAALHASRVLPAVSDQE